MSVLIGGAFTGLVLAPLAWWVTNFVCGPWLAFLKLRAEIKGAFMFYANVSHLSRDHEIDEYIKRFRELASELDGVHHTFGLVTHWYEKWKGYDLDEGVKGLIGVSNSVLDRPALHQHQVEKALGLPLTHTAEDILSLTHLSPERFRQMEELRVARLRDRGKRP